jgi:hypothetical protein
MVASTKGLGPEIDCAGKGPEAYTNDTRPLVKEGAPQKQHRNCQTVIISGHEFQMGARHQDLLTD